MDHSQDQRNKPDWTRTEYGTVEGEIIGATLVRAKPALTIKERLSGARIHCILSSELANQVGPTYRLEEAWGRRRYAITGALHYKADGRLKAIDAIGLREIMPWPVNLEELHALNLLPSDESPDQIHARLWGDG